MCNDAKRKFSNGRHFETVKHFICCFFADKEGLMTFISGAKLLLFCKRMGCLIWVCGSSKRREFPHVKWRDYNNIKCMNKLLSGIFPNEANRWKWSRFRNLTDVVFQSQISIKNRSKIEERWATFQCGGPWWFRHDYVLCWYIQMNVAGDAVCCIFKLSKCVEELRYWLKDNIKLSESKTGVFVASSPFT